MLHCWSNGWARGFVWVAMAIASNPAWSQSVARTTPPSDGKSAYVSGSKIDWDAPLPSAVELKQRVLKNLKQSEAEQERYVCKTIREEDDTDKSGNVKQRHVRQYDMFFVNGEEIDELTGKDGKPLSAGEKDKETQRIQKEIKKDSDAKFIAKRDAQDDKQLDTLLHMLRYTNGHRS